MRYAIAGALVASVASSVGPAIAERPVVVPAEDTRTQAQVSRRFAALSTSIAWVDGRDEGGRATAMWFQLGLGPVRWRLPFRGSSMGALDKWAVRFRAGVANADVMGTAALPLTIAAQRIAIHDTLAVAPLIHLQTGIELAVSTPWLSNRRRAPVPAFAASAETELASNGWSLRPAAWHVRLDALVCRSIHVEAGVGPEVFRSTMDPARGLDLGLRWHGQLGVALACPSRPGGVLDDVTVVLQYRARALLYNRDAPSSYDDTVSLALQYQLGQVALAAFAALEVTSRTLDHRMLGLRAIVELGGPR